VSVPHDPWSTPVAKGDRTPQPAASTRAAIEAKQTLEADLRSALENALTLLYEKDEVIRHLRRQVSDIRDAIDNLRCDADNLTSEAEDGLRIIIFRR
jgi:hypothetical protein